MAKKIGILTFHNAINYGALFQALSLQSFIEKEVNAIVRIIDLTTDDHIKGYRVFSLSSPNVLKNIALKAWNSLYYFKLKKRNNRFLQFKKDKLHLSDTRYKNLSDIEQANLDYDILISGSDQVFHPRIKNCEIYYLHFKTNNTTRIAYAPSFGISNISPEESSKIIPWLKDFDYLSCREQKGSEIIESLLGKRVPVVCDPVFLPDDAFWENLVACSKPMKEKYIFMFDLNGGSSLAQIAVEVAKHTGLKVICASFNILTRYKGIKKIYNLGPLEWLNWMKHAEFVISDSFHGSAIGLRLNRKVISYVAMPSASSRLETLFCQLGIEDQLIDDYTKFNFSEIRFADYKEKLSLFSSKSKKYLLDAINS